MPSASPLLLPLLNAFDDPAMLLNGQSIIAANAPAKTMFGPSLEGHDIRLAIRHPQALDLILARNDDAAASHDLDLIGIGSSERPWTLRLRPLTDGIRLLVLVDRTAQISAERMRTDFVANASHELRTPLSTIMGYSETLAEDGPLDEGLRQRFGATIHSESQRMLRIIEDLMSLSRIEADRYRAPAGSVDLGRVARIAIDDCRLQADQKNCRILLDVEPDMPAVRGDQGQLLQVTENLISNAIRYGSSGEAPQIDVTISRTGDMALLSVRDHGEGVAPEHLPRLTQRFYRVDDARSQNSGGTGLGLAIVKHIVERHRGRLDIRSTPQVGTEVRVLLPLV